MRVSLRNFIGTLGRGFYTTNDQMIQSNVVLPICPSQTLQTVTPIGFTINHVKYFFFYFSTLFESRGPIISGTTTMFRNENILGIIQMFIFTITDIIDYSRFQIKQLKIGSLGDAWGHVIGGYRISVQHLVLGPITLGCNTWSRVESH